jgi:hypothetical protein
MPINYWAARVGLATEPPKRNVIAAGLSSGVDQIQGLGYSAIGGVADALGINPVRDWANERADLNQWEAQQNGRPDLERIEDQSLGSALPFAAYQISKQVPTLAAIAGAQLLPGAGQAASAVGLTRLGAIAPRVLGGGGLQAGASVAARRAALAQGADFGASTLAGTALGYGSLYGESVEGGDPSPYKSALLAPLYGVSEAVLPAAVKGALRTPTKLVGNMPTRMLKAGGVAAPGEMGTELFQNELEMGMRDDLTDEEKFSRRLNSGTVGGLVGGSVGSLAGVRGQSTAPIDLLTTSRGFEDVQGQRSLNGVFQMPADPRLGDLTPDWETTQGFEGVTPLAPPQRGLIGPTLPTTHLSLTELPGVDPTPSFRAAGDPPLTDMSGVGRNPTASLDIPGLSLQGDNVSVDSFGNATGNPVDEQLMNDPGAAASRQAWLQRQAEEQKTQKIEAEKRAELADLNAELGTNSDKYKQQHALLKNLKALRESGLITVDQYAEQVALLRGDKPLDIKGVRTFVKDVQKTSAAQQTNAATAQAAAPAAPAPVREAPPATQVNTVAEAANVLLNDAPAPAAAPAAPAAAPNPNVAAPSPVSGQAAAPAPAATPVAAPVSAAAPAPAAAPLSQAPAPAPAPAAQKPAKAQNGQGDVVKRVTARLAENPRAIVLGNDIDFAALKELVEPVDPRMHHALRLALGVDKDGNRLDKPMSMSAAAEAAGIGKSHDKISKLFTLLGLTKDVRNRFTASTAQANERADGDIGADADTAGTSAETVEVQETSTRLLSDESTEDRNPENNELSAANGFGQVDAGGSQGKVESLASGDIRNTKWFQKLVGARAIGSLDNQTLAQLVAKAAPYVDSKASASTINEILAVVSQRSKDPEIARYFENALRRAYDNEFQGTTGTDEKADTGSVPDDDLGTDGASDRQEATSRSGESSQEGDSRGRSESGNQESKAAPTVVTKKKRRAVEQSASGNTAESEQQGDEGRRKLAAALKAKTTDTQREKLEQHYGADRTTSEFWKKLGDDVSNYVNKGAEAVAGAIRSIIKAVSEGVLAVALVINPAAFQDAFAFNLPQVVEQTRTEVVQIREQVPDSAIAKMSEAARVTYENMAPAAKLSGKGFMIADKPNGMLHIFNADGTVFAQEAALYGKDKGDTLGKSSLEGGPKITPAGKFTLEVADNAEYDGGKVLNLAESKDDTGFVAVHSVYLGDPKEQRGKRLTSGKTDDKRVSYGCINTAKDLFVGKLLPSIGNFDGGMIFVLPDLSTAEAVFPAQTRTETTTETFEVQSAEAGDTQEQQGLPRGERRPATKLSSARRSGRRGQVTMDGEVIDVVEGTMADAMATPGFTETAANLRRSGMGHLLDAIESVQFADQPNADWEAMYGLMDGKRTLVINSPRIQTPGRGGWALNHELAHVADKTETDGPGVISNDPLMQLSVTRTRIIAGKDATVARELLAFYNSDPDDGFSGLLTYPLNRALNSDLSAHETQQELFAQVFAIWQHPSGRALIMEQLPATAQFMEVVSERIAQDQQGRTGGTASALGAQSGQAASQEGRNGQPGRVRTLQAARQSRLVGAGNAGAEKVITDAARRIAGATGAILAGDAVDAAKRMTLSLMPLADIVDRFKASVPAIGKWYTGMQGIIATRGQLSQEAEKIAIQAEKLKGGTERVNEFLAESTVSGKWGYDPQVTGKTVTVDAAMAAKFRQLNAEEQAVVKAVFDHGQKMLATKRAILSAAGLTDREFNRVGELDGPYAPLKRFGDYIAVLKSAELRAAEEQARQDGDNTRVNELKRDPAHYIVSAFDTAGQAKQFAWANSTANGGQFAFSDSFRKADRAAEDRQMDANVLRKVLAAAGINPDIDSDAKAAMVKMLQDMYFQSLDEHHARTSGLRRMNRAGYDGDMMRSFLANARADAGFLANVKHGKEVNEAFYEMQRQVKDADGKREYQDAVNTVTQHYADSLNLKETPIQDRMVAFTSGMQLMTSIGYHLTNATQPFMVTVPKLGADFNDYQGAWKHVLAGYSILKEIGLRAYDLSKVRDAGLRAALQRASDMGVLDVGMDEDLTQFTATRTGIGLVDAGSRLVRNVLHKLRQISRIVETANRVSSATAAYRMALEKGKTVAEAQDYAVRILQTTQGDFSRVGSPLLLKKLPKVVTQYRKYQFMMAALYANAFNQAVWGSAEEKAIGRRMLAFKLFHTSMAAGVLGMPLMNLAAAVFSMMGSDDEPADLERSLRRLIGDDMVADVLLRGPLNFIGLDMSAKLGDDKIFSIMPYGTWDFTSAKGVRDTAFGLLGPSASQIGKMADGIGFMAQGDFYRGVEKVVPKGIESGMKAFRIANEGYTLKNGDVMFRPEEINSMGLLFDAMGLSSSEMKRMEWLRSQQYEIGEFYQERTRSITRQYVEAIREKDAEAAAEARDAWMELQAGKDRLRYLYNDSPDALKRQPLSTLLRAPNNADKREAKLQRGAAQ